MPAAAARCARSASSSTVLGIPPESLRVLSYDVGGNFGTRNRVFVEFGLVLWAARKLGRPVKFTATRSETFLSDYQGRDLVTRVELALRKDGRFLAMRATNISNVGARCVSLSPLRKGAGLIPGSYDIPAATLRARRRCSPTPCRPRPTAAPAGPEVTFAIERLIDTAAAQLGFDRVELRRKNLVGPQAMPYRNAVGMVYDSGRYEENMDWAMDIADWDGFAQRRREAAKRGKLLGRGLANYVESSIGAPSEQARITVRPGGPRRRRDRHAAERPGPRDELRAGGRRPALVSGRDRQDHPRRHRRREGRRRLAFRPLHAPRGDGVRQGRRRPDREGQAGRRRSSSARRRSRSSSTTAASRPRDTNRTFDFLELAKEAARHTLPDDLKDGLAVVTDNEMHEPVFPERLRGLRGRGRSRHRRVEITRYASVDDVGRCINPLIVHGQTHGGDRAGHRPGDVGAVLRRARFRPAARSAR